MCAAQAHILEESHLRSCQALDPLRSQARQALYEHFVAEGGNLLQGRGRAEALTPRLYVGIYLDGCYDWAAPPSAIDCEEFAFAIGDVVLAGGVADVIAAERGFPRVLARYAVVRWIVEAGAPLAGEMREELRRAANPPGTAEGFIPFYKKYAVPSPWDPEISQAPAAPPEWENAPSEWGGAELSSVELESLGLGTDGHLLFDGY